MQYEKNPANGFRYIILKQKARMHRRTAARPDIVMTTSPAPILRGGG